MISASKDMKNMNHLERLDQFIAEGRLTRKCWTATDTHGRQLACLLAAMVPECGIRQMVDACPADVMPLWLAHLTPWIDDSGSESEWPNVIRRYAAVAHRWHALGAEAWIRLEYQIRALCVREAMRHTKNTAALEACERVVVLCDAVAAGGVVEAKAMVDAAAAAEAGAAAAEAEEARVKAAAWNAFSAGAAAWNAFSAGAAAADAEAAVAAETAWSPAIAAWSAAHAAAATAFAVRAACSAAQAAQESAHAAAGLASAAAREEHVAVRWAAVDRLIDQILTVLELACDRAEAPGT